MLYFLSNKGNIKLSEKLCNNLGTRLLELFCNALENELFFVYNECENQLNIKIVYQIDLRVHCSVLNVLYLASSVSLLKSV